MSFYSENAFSGIDDHGVDHQAILEGVNTATFVSWPGIFGGLLGGRLLRRIQCDDGDVDRQETTKSTKDPKRTANVASFLGGKPPSNCKVCGDIHSWAANAQASAFSGGHGHGGSGRKATSKRHDTAQEHTAVQTPKTAKPLPPPPDGIVLGNSGWALLHTIASYYPDTPTPAQKKAVGDLWSSLGELYPCGWCAEHLRETLVGNPPKADSREDLELWTCQMHNEVNRRLGKEEFDCTRVRERWRDGNEGDEEL